MMVESKLGIFNPGVAALLAHQPLAEPGKRQQALLQDCAQPRFGQRLGQ